MNFSDSALSANSWLYRLMQHTYVIVNATQQSVAPDACKRGENYNSFPFACISRNERVRFSYSVGGALATTTVTMT